MRRTLTLALVSSLVPALAMAQDITPLAISYEMFEQAVPHEDLAECPAALAAAGRFCRLTMNHGGLNVFAFSDAGDQPLVAFQSWPVDSLTGVLR